MTEDLYQTDTAEREASPAQFNQYVTFRVDDRFFAADINQVREIKQWQPATPLPNQRHYTRGVLNLRGTIVPVHDLRARFGGSLTEATETHVVVIVCVVDQIIGVLVDAVSDIVTVSSTDIRPVPDAGAQERNLLHGLVETEEGMVAILNLETLFEDDLGQNNV